jgi:superfamily II DNA or RNA helicase
MIDAGFLVDPLIYMHRISTPQFKGRYGAELIEACITTNAERNTKIAKIAQEAFGGGKSVLIIARLLDHIEALRAAVETLGLPVATCIGETSAQERKSAVESLLRREKIVISNVLGEGVDLPALEVVIVAAGGKDPKETMQRLRCLTACVGKNQAIVHDFHDACSTYLMQHSEIRLATYAREFRVTKTYKERPESCSKRHYNMFPS